VGKGGITTGSDGALWFLAEAGAAIGRMTTSGSVTTFPLPPGDDAGAVTPGPDGALWFTIMSSGGNAIGRLTTSGQMRTYTSKILGTAGWGTTSFNRLHHRILWDITAGPNDSLWFSEQEYSNLGRAWIGTITTSGLIKDRELPRGAHPGPLTEGPDGAIWFGTINPNGGNAIGRVTTSKKFRVSRFSSAGDVGQVLGITAGPDGALWFTNYSVPGDTGFSPYPSVGRLTTAGAFTTYGSAYVTEGAMAITTGPDGAMWFIDHLNDTLGRITVP
jgi:virginiamycin B lyase